MHLATQPTGQHQAEEPATADDQASRLRFRVNADLAHHPLIDGYTHPAAKEIEAALRPRARCSHCGGSGTLPAAASEAQTPAWVLPLLEEMIADNGEGVLTCLMHLDQPPGDSGWRRKIISRALSSDDLMVRDVAVQACEQWQDAWALDALRSAAASESTGYLKDYMAEAASSLAHMTRKRWQSPQPTSRS